MGLTNKKEDQLRQMPVVETKILKSADERFIIHKTMITDIKPAEYYRVVLDSKSSSENSVDSDSKETESDATVSEKKIAKEKA